jgi:hypothetical protein
MKILGILHDFFATFNNNLVLLYQELVSSVLKLDFLDEFSNSHLIYITAPIVIFIFFCRKIISHAVVNSVE